MMFVFNSVFTVMFFTKKLDHTCIYSKEYFY
jgi:hypothetical protein